MKKMKKMKKRIKKSFRGFRGFGTKLQESSFNEVSSENELDTNLSKPPFWSLNCY